VLPVENLKLVSFDQMSAFDTAQTIHMEEDKNADHEHSAPRLDMEMPLESVGEMNDAPQNIAQYPALSASSHQSGMLWLCPNRSASFV
jgi:hypothetical protein